MVSISEKIYQDLASKLINELQNTYFFNGCCEIDYPELYTTFHCTLLVYREKNTLRSPITEVLSVWWEFETASSQGFEYNDFSWAEFYEYLQALF